MTNASRKIYTIRNTIVEMLTYGITLLLDLIVRVLISRYIGVEYLGLNGLYSSIIAIFSVAEAGFGSVMWFFLYEPVAKDDKERIKSIVGFAKKIYLGIAIIISILSLLILPFLQFFITTNVSMTKVKIYFLLYALSSVCSYLMIYKTVLLGANQKNYIYKLFTISVTLGIGLLQCILLIVTKNFIFYLVCKILINLLINIFTTIYTNKKYPYLKEKKIEPLSKNSKLEITKKTGAMFFSKVGSSVSRSIDNIIISIFFSITIVGYYTNYTLILTGVSYLIINTINGSCASVGNLWVTSSKQEVEKVFERVHFLENWIITFCSICVFVLTENFISLFFGQDYKLGMKIVTLLTILIYIEKMNLSCSVFKDAKGLFWNDRFRPLIEAGINIVFSLVCVKLFGLEGILLGTIFSIITTTWVQPYVLYKHGFEHSSKIFFIKQLIDFCVFIILTVLTYFICSFIACSVLGFIFKILVCLLFPNIVLVLINLKDKNFHYYIKWIKSWFNKNKVDKKVIEKN